MTTKPVEIEESRLWRKFEDELAKAPRRLDLRRLFAIWLSEQMPKH